MANVLAFHSVGDSLVTFLRHTYPATVDGLPMPACDFALLSSGELPDAADEGTRITLYLYRVTVNEHARQQRPAHRPEGLPPPLSLDLHFLLTAWSSSAEDELVTLAWAMRQLYMHPLLDASSLTPNAGWRRDEVVQIIPSELPTEDMMRIWDALEPGYRLSVSYIARLVRLDPDAVDEAAPVVATRLGYGPAVPVGVEP